jgi:hypothetical protein
MQQSFETAVASGAASVREVMRSDGAFAREQRLTTACTDAPAPAPSWDVGDVYATGVAERVGEVSFHSGHRIRGRVDQCIAVCDQPRRSLAEW